MKTSIIYFYSILMTLMMALPAKAQVSSPQETNSHGEMVMRKEHRRERVRADKEEKKAAKAEKRINKKAKYKKRRKVKIKQERT